ncbi:MAG: ATP-dependent DNA helicase RecG [Ruminococcus sp.]|nr:ATP-dependent DNA helicase RecG [Ruminococcus sp.]
MAANLFSDIEFLKGVGRAKGEKYRKLGISTPYDLLYHIPRDYMDFRTHIPVAQAENEEYCVLKLTITKKLPPKAIRKGLVICHASATDGIDDIIVVVYNNVYAFHALKEFGTYYMYGKVTGGFTRKEIHAPVYIPADSPVLIQPVYKLTQGLPINAVRTNMQQALSLLEDSPFETLPQYIREKYALPDLVWSLKNIHFPETNNAAEIARRRISFEELLKLQLGMLMLKIRKKKTTSYVMDKSTDMADFYNSLPFELTEGQSDAVNEITADMCSGSPMNRLLQGDVGSGKTAVAAAACCFAAKNGIQSAVMAPTEILAAQHYRTFSSFLDPLGIKVALLTGSTPAKQKAEIREKLLSGEIDLVAGTHAIIQKDVEYKSLGLVITDEQHRFGVSQRAALAEKGDSPHRLIMSATPIPRTLALNIFGDLDVTSIRQLPKGRSPVKTYAVTGKKREGAFSFLRARLDEGRQGYVVCPMIEDSESELFAVKSYAENAEKTTLKGYTTALLHGRMKAAEKDEVMEKFSRGELQVLICTTVVEVGVDVPNAAVMIIENAERFGLSQLHQLRGRVGRGQYESTCILITDNKNEDCIQRMKIISATTDGFKIAQEDLNMRGPGDFFGSAQHGLPPLKIASAYDISMLSEDVRRCAEELLRDDPNLDKPEHKAIKMDTLKFFNKEVTS